MTATFAIGLAILSCCSLVASYYIGRDSMRADLREEDEKRRRWQEWEDEE